MRKREQQGRSDSFFTLFGIDWTESIVYRGLRPRHALLFRTNKHMLPDMETINATQLKSRLGDVLARAALGPVAIERHGRVIAYLVPALDPTEAALSSSRAKPRSLSRVKEERLLELCASRDFRPSRWERAGDRELLAGVAALLASVDMFDRTRLFALAERLKPGMSTMEGYSRWLKSAPVRPARFLPMLRARLKHRDGQGAVG